MHGLEDDKICATFVRHDIKVRPSKVVHTERHKSEDLNCCDKLCGSERCFCIDYNTDDRNLKLKRPRFSQRNKEHR